MPPPPAGLSAETRSLWQAIVRDYDFSDAPSVAVLRQLCDSIDGVRQCQAAIRADGLMIDDKRHPLLSVEAEYRRSVLACCRALRLAQPEL